MDRTTTTNQLQQIQHEVQRVYRVLPIEQAMSQLVVAEPLDERSELVEMIEQVLRTPPLANRVDLAAGLWLYADELERSHALSQSDDTATGAFWHGILHRREGDFANAHYWFRRAGRHPAMLLIQTPKGGGYDGHEFIDDVESAHHENASTPELVELQRTEWRVLFDWCAAQ